MGKHISRRRFLRGIASGAAGAAAWNTFRPFDSPGTASAQGPSSTLYLINRVPTPAGGVYHEGVKILLKHMGRSGLKFFKSSTVTTTSGPAGLIASDDVVVIKVNAQWKYRGATNSDVVKGIIKNILLHPDGFTGEVIVFENGQGYGSLDCDAMGRGSGGSPSYPDREVHANAENELQSFSYVVDTMFADPRVTKVLMDPYRSTFISGSDHSSTGFRMHGVTVSYPCFWSTGGRRVEWKEGIWNGSTHLQKLKIINVPVLKHHAGTGTTAALKHMFGVLSMEDGNFGDRHYGWAGHHAGIMFTLRPPVLNILDCIWVTQTGWAGYPESYTTRKNMLMASTDPVALDYWSAKYILYPIDSNSYHNPDAAGDLRNFLTAARDQINAGGGINGQPVTMDEAEMQLLDLNAVSQGPRKFRARGRGGAPVARFDSDGDVILKGNLYQSATSGQLAPTSETELLIKDAGGAVVARADGATGNLYIKGTASSNLSSISPGASCELVVKTSSGAPAVMINSSGNLYALGMIYENGNP